ncbi:MAG: hypothetical protein K2Q21_13960 [Chitinophagaceae bacterium]|nr:hypothetical protein [Chitinophagaceae bacterium]
MKYLQSLLLSFLIVVSLAAQDSFIEIQKKANPKFGKLLMERKEGLLKQFNKLNLNWPPRELYIRSFKYDSELEVWARNNHSEAFVLFKTYKICALSGTMGPKRMNGDFQVPEGFYYVNEFKPNSSYHMALGINYPNESDQLLSDSIKPGGDIFIHGKCVTQGCIPIQDFQIEELYLLAAYAHEQGQDYIPVHIFPIRFNNAKDISFLKISSRDDSDYQRFTKKMKFVFDYFEQHHQVPVITITAKGDYQIY